MQNDPKTFKLFLGISKETFDTIYEYVRDALTPARSRPTKDILAVFFCRMRQGWSQEIIVHFFDVGTQSHVSKHCKTALEALEKLFVLHFLGYQHVSRDDIVRRTNKLCRQLLKIMDNAIALIFDGI